ncbi:hypothetical protein HDU79_004436 [Rhizoclosmatium sp. JEL0117]|nr:hypothetical protein HDU79_004436 [Rhizoclosmatium sp. JEL0117]
MVLVITLTLAALPNATEDRIQASIQGLNVLEQAPGVRSVRFGRTFTTAFTRGFTHQLVVELDKDAIPIYRQQYAPSIENHLSIAFDLETSVGMEFDDGRRPGLTDTLRFIERGRL